MSATDDRLKRARRRRHYHDRYGTRYYPYYYGDPGYYSGRDYQTMGPASTAAAAVVAASGGDERDGLDEEDFMES